MKSIHLSILALAAGSAFAAEVYTPVVGYITHTVVGAGSAESADTFISPTLINPTEFSGASSSAPSGATITFSGDVPTTFDGSYVLEITSGANEGWWSTVVSSTSNSITVNDDFPADSGSNVDVSVRKHATLELFLGDNNPGLAGFDGENANDEIQILDASSGGVSTYAFVSGDVLQDPSYPNGAWFDLLNSTVANDIVIEPGSAIKVKRVGSSDLSFVSTGTVKTTETQVDIFTNFNWIGTYLASGGTLGGMSFQSQLNPFDGENPNYDELVYVRADQSASPFAVVNDGGLIMYDLLNSAAADSEPFSEGTGLIINRIGNSPSTITIPGNTISQ
jgi:hypothetical protein